MPEMCPATISNVQYLADTFKKNSDINFIFISFDYLYDTPKQLLETYGPIEKNHKNITFLSSVNHLNDLYMITKQTGLAFGGVEENNIGHTMRTLIIDENRTLIKIYEGFDWKPAVVKRDIENLLKLF